MSAVKLLTSVMLASLVMTSLVRGACYERPVTIGRSPGLPASQAALSIYCTYKGERKNLYTLWIDEADCQRCLCVPKGLECCGLPRNQARQLCGPSI